MAGEASAGYMLMEPLVNTATSLVVRSDGRVAGLVARQYGKLGAEVTFLIDPQQTARGILVNGRSQRDVPEDMYSDRNRQLTLYQQDDTAYLIIDGDAQEEAMAATSATPFLKRPATWVSDTVAELEGEIGLPTGSLQATASVYKDAAARGEDPSRHKKSEWLKPIGRPVGAIDLRASCAGFTLGALQTTLDAEVLHVSGEPVPGLYAAGRCTAGVAAWGLRERHLTRRRQLYGRRAGGTAAKG